MREDYRNQSGYFSPTENAVVHHWDNSNGFEIDPEPRKPKKRIFNTAEYLEKVKTFTDGQIVDEQIRQKEISHQCGAFLFSANKNPGFASSMKYQEYSERKTIAKEKLRIIHEVVMARDRGRTKDRKKMVIRLLSEKLHELMTKEECDSFFEDVRKNVDAECGQSLADRIAEGIGEKNG